MHLGRSMNCPSNARDSGWPTACADLAIRSGDRAVKRVMLVSMSYSDRTATTIWMLISTFGERLK